MKTTITEPGSARSLIVSTAPDGSVNLVIHSPDRSKLNLGNGAISTGYALTNANRLALIQALTEGVETRYDNSLKGTAASEGR